MRFAFSPRTAAEQCLPKGNQHKLSNFRHATVARGVDKSSPQLVSSEGTDLLAYIQFGLLFPHYL